MRYYLQYIKTQFINQNSQQMKSVTRVCVGLMVMVLSTSLVFAQGNISGKNAISQEEMALIKEHAGKTVHPNHQGQADYGRVPW